MKTKICKTCHKEKPLTEFNINCYLASGVCYRGSCMDCRRESERIRWHKRKYQSKYYVRKRNKIQDMAQSKLKTAVKKGVITPKPCLICGNIKVEAHHPDYNFPLKVEWLCHKHHMRTHRLKKRD